MAVSLADMMARLPDERQEKVAARARTLIAEEMSLRELRNAMGKTQLAVARKLGLNQESISRVEQRADVLISTLDGYVHALGGRLRLVAEFEGREAVELSGFGALNDAGPAEPRAKTPTKAKA